MRIEVQRLAVSGATTLSHVRVVDGLWRGFGLEDGPTPNPYGLKVKGQTRIPDGEYELELVHSPMAKRYAEKHPQWHRMGMVGLKDVPGFTNIRIHPGNTHEDTDGCLLLGYGVNATKLNEEYRIVQSADAYKDFYLEVAKRLAVGEPGRIIIWSPVGP